ncbi:MerR family transcriptional regulator [Pseudohoeflea coraliihabitans]|uniref:MerR family transcriptional regulator n=1 Tax=Pseudohoeflea coraliihabitans TaxID=2860393 RepID=A0ABS6WRJ4_9HYPH|nr:MerR family transcriptional regulator [Pseudohoeflea sp. DP4N28-3]MBW3098587.1 MerR family transcriptional regulator [Pseudohoeflea sp. DP4N28-3]
MKIGEVAQRSGLSVHTIRYYERIGLVPRAGRDAAGHRDYDAAILTWIAFLSRLKETGMPLRQMVHYAELREQGDTTANARRHILKSHRSHVRDRMRRLTEALDALDAKIFSYTDKRKETPE